MSRNQTTFKHPSDGFDDMSFRLKKLRGMGVKYDTLIPFKISHKPDNLVAYAISSDYDRQECRIWCLKNARYPYSYYTDVFFFHKNEDVTEFIMRFL